MENSPFGKLSGELRNIIYELVLGGIRIHLKTKQGSDSEKEVVCTASGDEPHTALLRTCNQIDQEASPIVYHDNEFHFVDYEDSVGTFKSFTSMIGPANSVTLSKCYIYSAMKVYAPAKYKCPGWGDEWFEWTVAAAASAKIYLKCKVLGIVRWRWRDQGPWTYNFDLSNAGGLAQQWTDSGLQILKDQRHFRPRETEESTDEFMHRQRYSGVLLDVYFQVAHCRDRLEAISPM